MQPSQAMADGGTWKIREPEDTAHSSFSIKNSLIKVKMLHHSMKYISQRWSQNYKTYSAKIKKAKTKNKLKSEPRIQTKCKIRTQTNPESLH